MAVFRTVLPLCMMAVSLACAPARAAPDPRAVVVAYADVGQAMYGDAWATARALHQAVAALLAHPDATTLAAARAAWKAARTPYAESEGFRFGNPLVDRWQAKVNAWPINPGLIDGAGTAVAAEDAENPLAHADVVAHPMIDVGGEAIDATIIDAALLRRLQDADGVATNVATGYHVVEFLLWGDPEVSGLRPASDFALDGCTHGHCDRRRRYLAVASEVLVEDLGAMADAWAPGGAARTALLAKPPDDGLAAILTGLGNLSFQAIAGERMKLGLILHDPDEAEDCFSDNTATEIVDNERGMASIYRGRYRRGDGTTAGGPGLADLAGARSPAAGAFVDGAMATASARLAAIAAEAAKGGYERLIAAGNAAGNHLVMVGVYGLVGQARAFQQLAEALGLDTAIEGADRLDRPR